LVGGIIGEFRDQDKYDVVFPLDCDEFVAVSGNHGFSCCRKEIFEHIEALRLEKSMVRVSRWLNNRPGFMNLFHLNDCDKSIVPVAYFKSIDHGFHDAKSLSNSDFVETKITYIHMHFKPFEITKAHARDKLAPFVNVNDVDALRSFSGIGSHLPRYLFMTKRDYYENFEGYEYPIVRFNGLNEILSALGVESEFFDVWCKRPPSLIASKDEILGHDIVALEGLFDVQLYYQANPDVKLANMDAAAHYCLFGFREGRPLQPSAAQCLSADTSG